jgi:hypothetical protein
MSVVITGTFAIGWSSNIVDSMKNQGYDIIGDPPFEDPFALLLHRIKNPHAIIVMTKLDIAPKHPEVAKVLSDLAAALLPDIPRYGMTFDADPHEYFGKCIADGYTGSFADSTKINPDPEYLKYLHVKRVELPAYIADMPHLLGSHITKELYTQLET